jgi:hypothetical protein
VTKLALKPIGQGGIPHALEMAERYRLLNDPEQAESICRDILAVDPDHQDALRTMVLALTDQLGSSHARASAQEARAQCAKLVDAYERAYYTGLIHERETRAFLRRPNAIRSAAYDGFRSAMEWYDRAEALHVDAVDPRLRWNSCARTIAHEGLEPEVREPEVMLE